MQCKHLTKLVSALCLSGATLMNALLAVSAPFAYVTNQGDHTVSIVDVESNRVIQRVPVGKSPVGVAIDTISNRAYFSNVESRSVSVVDINTNQVIHSIQLTIAPVGLVLNKTGGQLYVADWFHDQILVFD
ncbi:MAG: YncE family protein, partial [Methylophilus sp.]|nr:YncE family protein [Methylophilus sp.]